jgi:carnosine N-methyltransferase
VVTNARRRSFFALPSRHQTLLLGQPFNFLQRFQDIEDAIDTNANCAMEILSTGLSWAGFESLLDQFGNPPKYHSTFVPKLAFAPLETTEEDESNWAKPNLPCIPGIDKRENQRPSADDMSKAASTVRHLYREWSAEGHRERDVCFSPVVHYLVKHFRGIQQWEWHNIKILNPGCGLGRLVFDLACLGFRVEGCEISYHMLVGSMHLMNAVKSIHQYRIYPWVLSSSNHVSHENRMRSVQVPDVCPGRALAEATEAIQQRAYEVMGTKAPEIPMDRLGIAAGDFCVVYKGEQYTEQYDAVATVFFLDTAKNPLAYMETVSNCLKTGGIWLNLGPLKWHFEAPTSHNATLKGDDGGRPKTPSDGGDDEFFSGNANDLGIGNPGSVELMDDDIHPLLIQYGFEIVHQEKSSKKKGMGYIWDEESMETNVYFPSFWVAKKVGAPKVDVGDMPYGRSKQGKTSSRREAFPIGPERDAEVDQNMQRQMTGREEHQGGAAADLEDDDGDEMMSERTWNS